MFYNCLGRLVTFALKRNLKTMLVFPHAVFKESEIHIPNPVVTWIIVATPWLRSWCRSSQYSFLGMLFGDALKITGIWFFFFFFFFNNMKAMAPHSSTLAWQVSWMEEPGRLRPMGSLGVRHDWATSLSLFTFMYWRRKWQPTPVFLPGESQGRGSQVGCRLWGRTE